MHTSAVTGIAAPWSGHVVARILPNSVTPVNFQQQKPDNAQIVPSTLVPGTGPAAYRPPKSVSSIFFPHGETIGTSNDPIPSRILAKKQEDGSKMRPTFESSGLPPPRLLPTTSSASSSILPNVDDGDVFIRIETYLFPPPSECEVDTATVVMLRRGQEPAKKCLERLEISIAKKIKTLLQNRLDPKGFKGKPDLPKISTSIIVQGPDHNVEHRELSDDTTAKGFWSLALAATIGICVHLDNATVIHLPIECNPPTITAVSAFENFRGKLFPGIPVVLEVETAYADSVIVDWYVNEDLTCHDSVCYTPTERDGGKRLSVMISPRRPGHDGTGCQEAYQFANTIEYNLPENALLRARPDFQLLRSEAETGCEKRLRVMSYNILKDQNVLKSDIPWASKEILDRARRMPLLLYEILSYHADIVCLQEVDELMYNTLFRPVMKYFNYDGYFSVKRSNTREGCAMFYSLGRFQRCTDEDLKTFSISKALSDIATASRPEWTSCSEPISKLFSRRTDLLQFIQTKLGHVLQIALLRDLDGSTLLAANTHLFYHPIATHIRALQCFAIAKQLSVEQGSQGIPFVLCGDLNSELWCGASLLMNRMTPKNYRKFQLHLNTFNWEESASVEGIQAFDDDFPELRLPDSFPKIVSGYQDYPEYTHSRARFKGSLDHILLSSSTLGGNLQPLRQAAIPPLNLVESGPVMPGPTFPSDHVSILADISWKP